MNSGDYGRFVAESQGRAPAFPDVVTWTGMPVYYAYPERSPVHPADLRRHLAASCRYVGAIPVSILLHTSLAVQLARAWQLDERTLQLVAVHDLHEAYVPDLPSRLKPLVSGWRGLERAWENHVHRCLGVPTPSEAKRELIRDIDLACLVAEMHYHEHPGLRLVTQRHSFERAERLKRERPRFYYELNDAWHRTSDLTDDQRWADLMSIVPALGLDEPLLPRPA